MTKTMDIAAYTAGRKHFTDHGFSGPDMETLWKRHGRKEPRRGAAQERVVLERDFPDRAHLWTTHWEFASWQQGVVDAAEEAHQEWVAAQVQGSTPTA